jgi:hypothetical protein
MAGFQLAYKPGGPVLKEFLKDDHFVRGIRGPVGSGTSSACCIEIFRRASQQARGPDGVRKSRWGIIRNTNPELKTTTIKTWLDWFPEHIFGKFKWEVPYTHVIRSGDVEIEVIFLALDRPEDVGKLLSLEFTGIWINEAREVPKAVVDAATMRVGRFPSVRNGGATWYGVIMDTNAPEEDHWWPIMEGSSPIPEHIPEEEAKMLVCPEDWQFFIQPAALDEVFDASGKVVERYEIAGNAENIENLPADYYLKIITGKTKSWIDVYVMNRLGSVEDGKRVYPEYNDEVHTARTTLVANPDLDLWIGIDFGLTPAAIFGQRLSSGRWAILRELVTSDMGAARFALLLKAVIADHYPNYRLKIYGDPAGDIRAQTDEVTPFTILRANGVKALPAPTNDPVIRIEAVTGTLTRLIDGLPGFLIDPSCTVLRQGFRSGYHYRRLKVGGEARYETSPAKNRFSHPHDALQYLLCAGGEMKTVIGAGTTKPTTAKRDFSVWDMRGSRRKGGWSNLRHNG